MRLILFGILLILWRGLLGAFMVVIMLMMLCRGLRLTIFGFVCLRLLMELRLVMRGAVMPRGARRVGLRLIRVRLGFMSL